MWISSIDAAIPAASCLWAGVVRVDDALGCAARCRHVALCQRGIGAFEVIVFPALVDLQADRIVRIIGLGPSRRRCRSHPNCQNRQSQNAHQNLFSGPCPSTGHGITTGPTAMPHIGSGGRSTANAWARASWATEILRTPPRSDCAAWSCEKHFFTWCGRWDSNPHDVAIEGF